MDEILQFVSIWRLDSGKDRGKWSYFEIIQGFRITVY